MHATRRANRSSTLMLYTQPTNPKLGVAFSGSASLKAEDTEERVTSEAPKQPLLVLYGSNSGSSEAFAQRIFATANVNGFNAKIDTLDSCMYYILLHNFSYSIH